MWAQSSTKPPAEPSWVKIAHALLIFGDSEVQKSRWPTQTDFWHLVAGLNGRGLGRNAGARTVATMEAEGRYFLRQPLRFGPGMGLVLGVAIGTETVRAALFTANGDIAKVSQAMGVTSAPGVTFDPTVHAAEAGPMPEPSQLSLPVEALLGRIVAVMKSVALRALRDPHLTISGRLPLLGVACGWPAPVNRLTKLPTGGALRSPGWGSAQSPRGRPPSLPERIAERLGAMDAARSHALNDANAVAFGVAFDVCRRDPLVHGPLGGVILAVRAGGGLSAGTMVMSTRAFVGDVDHTGGDGMGGRVDSPIPRSRFLNAYLLEGNGGVAGELGHWQVPDDDLREVSAGGSSGLAAFPEGRCICGRTRCLDLYASGTAVLKRLRASGVDLPDLPSGSQRAETSIVHRILRDSRDERVIRSLEDAGRLIGRSLAAPVLMLNPERIAMSGSLALDHVRNGIERERGLWQHVNEARPGLLHLLEPRENTYAVARGAALAVFRGQLYRRFDDPALDLSNLTLRLDEADVLGWDDRRGD